MSPNNFHSFRDSPTLLLSPQHQHQHYHQRFWAPSQSAHTLRYQSFETIMPSNTRSSSKSSNAEEPASSSPRSGPSTEPSTRPNSTSGPILINTHPGRPNGTIGFNGSNGTNISRKRARDEDTDMINLPPQITPATSPTSYYSNTIARRDPLTGQQTSVEGQTRMSTESIEEHVARGLQGMPRRGATEEEGDGDSPRRKAQRTTNGNGNVNGTDTSQDIPSTSNRSEEPVVDEYSRLLGIGWRQPSPNTMQGSARGWARYIETNYPLTNVEILAQTSEQTLVRAIEGTFLFHENLREGRLLSRVHDDAIARLRQNSRNPHFEGVNSMTPTPQANAGHSSDEGHSPSRSLPEAGAGVDVDAEMELD